jgi:hypothetical protein
LDAIRWGRLSMLNTHRRIIVSLGVYRSASTWISNVMTALLETAGPAKLVVADGFDDVFKAALNRDRVVVKTHQPAETLAFLISVASLPLVVSVRDPADCVASLVEQFGETIARAHQNVVLSCATTLRLASCLPHMLLRYEDDGERNAQSVRRIADYLDIETTPEQAEAIAARFSIPATRQFIDHLTKAGAFGDPPQYFRADQATQFHFNHIGAGRSRKSAVLPKEVIAAIEADTASFRRHFGYG